MTEARTYGSDKRRVVVVHGGPGAVGDMAPVGEELARRGYGVVEPRLRARRVKGQVEALREVIEMQAETPAVVIGHSWGAWLSMMLAAESPALVMRLILVGCGPLAAREAEGMLSTILGRLEKGERAEAGRLLGVLQNPVENREAAFDKLGTIIERAYTYEGIDEAEEGYAAEGTAFDFEVYRQVWPEAARMREEGRLMEIAGNIRCPVTAIHGDYDPHPAEGARVPLAETVKDFEFVLLERCGHKPWVERYAREAFYTQLGKFFDFGDMG